MNMADSGLFILKEDRIETAEGMRACRHYGRAAGEKAGV
jgi:hypothetical protein